LWHGRKVEKGGEGRKGKGWKGRGGQMRGRERAPPLLVHTPKAKTCINPFSE